MPTNPDRIYIGRRKPGEPKDSSGEADVFVKEGSLTRELRLEPSLAVRSHSPTGFSWGYGGSGPAQLALAILLDYYGDTDFALKYYQSFKWIAVAKWPASQDWAITGAEIEAAIRAIQAKEAKTPA